MAVMIVTPSLCCMAGKNRPLDEDELDFVNAVEGARAAQEAAWHAEQAAQLDAFREVSACRLWLQEPLKDCRTTEFCVAHHKDGPSARRALCQWWGKTTGCEITELLCDC